MREEDILKQLEDKVYAACLEVLEAGPKREDDAVKEIIRITGIDRASTVLALQQFAQREIIAYSDGEYLLR